MGRIFYALIPLIISSSCVKIPSDEACCQMLSPPSLECSIDQALESESFTMGDFPSANWWELFGDPQLSHLICKALSSNPTLQKAWARVRGAEAEAKIKKSKLFPTIGFSADIEWEYLAKDSFFRAFTPVIPSHVTDYEIDLDFHYEIDFWGKNQNSYRAALGIAKAQMAEASSATLILSTSVAAVYFKLQTHMQMLQLLTEEKKLISHYLDLTRSLEEFAVGSTIQTLSAEEHVLKLDQTILITTQKITIQKHMLKMLLGEGPDSEEAIELIEFSPCMEFPLPFHISSNLLARRSDLIAHIWKVEAAAHLVGAAKADFYPRVDLWALAGFNSLFVNKLFQWDNREATVKPAFYLPIFTGGRLKGNLRAKQAEFEEAIYSYNETVLKAVREVADEIVILKTVDENLKIEVKLVQNKEKNQNLIKQLYEEELGNLLGVIQSEKELLKEKYGKIHLQYQRMISALRLIKALGGGYCTTEVPFD